MDSSIELRNDGLYHLSSPNRHLTIRTTHREAGLVRMRPYYPNCASLMRFLPLAIGGQACLTVSKKKWTARGVGPLAGDRDNYVFRKGANPAAAIGTGAASYMAPTVASVRCRFQHLDAVGRLTHSRWPGTHPLVTEGRSTSLSPELEPDAFLSVFRRTSLNIPPFRKARIILLILEVRGWEG